MQRKLIATWGITANVVELYAFMLLDTSTAVLLPAASVWSSKCFDCR